MNRTLYIDSIEVELLINSKGMYSWVSMKDGSILKVLTSEYDNTIGNSGQINLTGS